MYHESDNNSSSALANLLQKTRLACHFFQNSKRSVVIVDILIHVTTSLLLRSLFYSFIPDQCVESSLQVKISSPARTVSIKQEPEDHLDLSKFQALISVLEKVGRY